MANYVEVPQAIAKLDWSMSFQRTGKFPLDRSTMFDSYADAVLYAAGDTKNPDKRGLCGTSYVGQVISVFENDVVTVYKIEADRSLSEVGTATAGDGKSIKLSEDGILSLVGFENATAGQQPRIVNKGTAEAPDLQIEWYTPDTSTVTGLAETVGSLKETVEGVTEEDGTVTKEGLTHKVNALEANKANKTDVYTKAEVDGKLTGALHYKGSQATFQALLDYIAAEAEKEDGYKPSVGDVWNIAGLGTEEGDVNVDASGIEILAGDNVIYNGTGWDVSTGAIDLSGYYTKSDIDDLLNGSTEKGIAGKVDKVEGSSLMTAEQAERLADVTKTEASEINGNIKIDDEEVVVYALPTADTETLGGVKSSTEKDKVAVETDGTMTINKVSGDKVEGAVAEASKVTNTLTVGSKQFDGSAAIEITTDDIDGLLPESVVKDTEYATDSVGGVVKSSAAQDKVAVEVDGTMSVNDISADKVKGIVSEAAKVTHKLTAGGKTFDGAADVEITAEDLGVAKTTDLDNYVKKADIATADAAGIVKSSTAKDNIAVAADGTMSINTVSGDKVEGNVATATNAEQLGGVASDNILVDGGNGQVKSAAAADKLANAHNIAIAGDATGTATFDGTADANITVTLKEVGTAGTYTKVTTDANGRVTAGENLKATDIPDLTLEKITDAGTLAAKDEIARTDINAEFEANIKALEDDSHKHDNKAVLDGIKASDITNWNETFGKIDGKADKATTLAGYGITDAYTKEEINGKLTGALHYKGTKDTYQVLLDEVAEPEVGDVWNISNAGGQDASGVAIDAGDNVIWNGEGWDVSSGTIDLSGYYTKAEADELLGAKANKAAFDDLTDKVGGIETVVGATAEDGLQKKVATNTSDITDLKKDVADLEDVVGADETAGLQKKVADNKAAIETLNGEASVTGSVKQIVAASATEINTAIENITKDGGAIDTKVEAAVDVHNKATDAHADLFDAKQNKAIQATITFEVSDFVESDTEPAAYKATKAVVGLDTSKNYASTVSPTLDSCAAVVAAQFYPTVEVNDGELTLYCVNAPTATIVVNGTFTEIQ